MNIHADDPRLTAYALGELDDVERAEVEAVVGSDPELQRAVDELRGTANQLRSEFAAEALPSAAAQTAPFRVPTPSVQPVRRWLSARTAGWSAVVAGTIIVAVGALNWEKIGPEFPKHLAVSRSESKAADRSAPERPSDPYTGPWDFDKHDWLGGKPARDFESPVGNPLPAPTRANVTAPEMEAAEFSELTVPQDGFSAMPSFGRELASPPNDFSVTAPASPARRRGRAQGSAREQREEHIPHFSTGHDGSIVFGESYAAVAHNPFIQIRDKETATSTFAMNVDTASYSNVRRFSEHNQLPPPAAVRIEELVNYFTYDYPQPAGDVPFSVNLEAAACPWNPRHRLVRIALKGRELDLAKRPPTNLVFLLDVSGSMQPDNKLPLVKQAMRLLVEQLTENDRVSIVTYAGDTGVALPATTGDQKSRILAAIDGLQAGGSTNGEGGIHAAYSLAVQNFIKHGANRVILATDGDFNVGISSDDALETLITEKAASGVFLTALGFGMGNLKDSKLERLADKGNGNYAYVDNLREARKTLVEQLAGTLYTIAKDVKLQVEFNPAAVRSYRLIGYENRVMANKDFRDDRKDAGEIGAGHTVTALYEIEPVIGANGNAGKDGDPAVTSRYQVDPKPQLSDAARSGELLTLRYRFKRPVDSIDAKAREIETPYKDAGNRYADASPDFRFAASVAAFGMLLRHSPHRGEANFDLVLELAQSSLGADKGGLRGEFVGLVRKAKELQRR